jgi:ribosomal small subunit protein bTHX
MGKGDKKSKRGKIISGTYGVRRPKKHRAKAGAAKTKQAKSNKS